MGGVNGPDLAAGLDRAVDTLNDWLAELDIDDPDGPSSEVLGAIETVLRFGRDARHGPASGVPWGVFYGAFLNRDLIRRGSGLLNRWRTPDAPEAERMARVAAEVVAAELSAPANGPDELVAQVRAVHDADHLGVSSPWCPWCHPPPDPTASASGDLDAAVVPVEGDAVRRRVFDALSKWLDEDEVTDALSSLVEAGLLPSWPVPVDGGGSAGVLTPTGPGCAACGMGGLVCSAHPDVRPAATSSWPEACPCGAEIIRCPRGCAVLVGMRELELLNIGAAERAKHAVIYGVVLRDRTPRELGLTPGDELMVRLFPGECLTPGCVLVDQAHTYAECTIAEDLDAFDLETAPGGDG